MNPRDPLSAVPPAPDLTRPALAVRQPSVNRASSSAGMSPALRRHVRWLVDDVGARECAHPAGERW
jgi:hypothetical protein